MFRKAFVSVCLLSGAFVACALAAAPGIGTYGVVSHLSWTGYGYRDTSCRWIAATGIGAVRCDCHWSLCQKTRESPLDFSRFDAVVESAERQGLRVLPILHDPPDWAKSPKDDLAAFEDFVFGFVRHYGMRLPEIEIWNEWNLEGFWGGRASAETYLPVLSAGYRAAKRANPQVRVLLGGTAGVPFAMLEELYGLGGAAYFDAMNVHPYSHPNAPEGHLDVELERLRGLMARFGDGKKDIVITEHGWPTHDYRIDAIDLRTGLKVARPEKSSWRILMPVTCADSDGRPQQGLADAVQDALPAGSVVTACFAEEFRRRLAEESVDAVVYPFDETFPSSVKDEVYAYVRAGGTLVDLGGAPFWFGRPELSPGVFGTGSEGDMSEFERYHLGFAASWTNPNVPIECRAFPTEAAKAAGFLGDPAGERAGRFLTRERLKAGDELVPTLVGKDLAGNELITSCVIRYGSDLKGRLVVSGVSRSGGVGTNDENAQARYLVRSMAIALAEDVKEYCWYEFRAAEANPYYSEDHFGLMHSDFLPKPAWGAYLNFTRRRPEGSVNAEGGWHNSKRTFFFPQWIRPDGVNAGVLWKLGEVKRCAIRFMSDDMVFRTHLGRLLKPARRASGEYVLAIGPDPIFFEGGKLVIPSDHNGKGK